MRVRKVVNPFQLVAVAKNGKVVKGQKIKDVIKFREKQKIKSIIKTL